jgi:hypothetical protein
VSRSTACSAFFFQRQVEGLQRPAQGGRADGRPAVVGQPGAQLREGGVRAVAHQVPDAPPGGFVQGGVGAVAVRAGDDRAGEQALPQQFVEEGTADTEGFGDLGAGKAALVAGPEDPLAQVQRVGFHTAPLDLVYLLYGVWTNFCLH